jgi:hypothetical protein
MGMAVNPYPREDMGDPMGLFFRRGYGHGIVILGGYLPIATSSLYQVLLVHLASQKARNMW